MLAIVKTCAVVGIDAQIVEVQVDFNPHGLPAFTVVGLPDSAVQESRERVRSAIRNSNLATTRRLHGGSSPGLDGLTATYQGQKRQGSEEHGFGLQFPNKRYTVNLAPASLRKEGPAYDLPMAIGVLGATDQVPLHRLAGAVFVGELSLDGSVRHVSGILPIVHRAWVEGYECIYVPEEDVHQAALVPEIDVIPVRSLGHLVEHLYELQVIPPYVRREIDVSVPLNLDGLTDFADVKGQEHVKRALEVAAAGGHNVLMIGPPGVGKTLIARALPGILPTMSLDEALEVTRIYSVADLLAQDKPLMRVRPYRAPHHTISNAGLVGGGSWPRPGEVSLAHRGVLFLDELPEFGAHTLEVLRQPLEDKRVTISRAKVALTFPANFMLVAAMNPCPQGYPQLGNSHALPRLISAIPH